MAAGARLQLYQLVQLCLSFGACGELRLLQEALLPLSLASPLTPAPAPAPVWLWGLVSSGGPCLPSWERRPRGLVVELLCVQNGAGVRGIRHRDGALGESGWGRLGG